MTQGVDPQLDLSDIDQLVKTAEHCNRLPVHPRHPYAGELVFTAFSGSHQDAIKKGMADQDRRTARGEPVWEVPYLPMNPSDVGRSYAAIIRINSQSGKGGIAYLLERDHGLILPRWFQQEFSAAVQRTTDVTEAEISSEEIWELFQAEYFQVVPRVELLEHSSQSSSHGVEIKSSIRRDGDVIALSGSGSGPIEAFVRALRDGEIADLVVRDFSEHAFQSGSDATAVAYVEVEDDAGRRVCGIGMHRSIVTASLNAIVSAENRRREVIG
jgi:2-isopropylmalate synthase